MPKPAVCVEMVRSAPGGERLTIQVRAGSKGTGRLVVSESGGRLTVRVRMGRQGTGRALS